MGYRVQGEGCRMRDGMGIKCQREFEYFINHVWTGGSDMQEISVLPGLLVPLAETHG